MLEQLWNACNQEAVLEIAEAYGLAEAKTYNREHLSTIVSELEQGGHEIADYASEAGQLNTARAGELVKFLKRKLDRSGKLDTLVNQSALLEVKYLASKAPAPGTLRRIERSLERARAVCDQVIQYLNDHSFQRPLPGLLLSVLEHHFHVGEHEEQRTVDAALASMKQKFRSIQRGLSTRVRLSDGRGVRRGEAGFVKGRKVTDLVYSNVGTTKTLHSTDTGVVLMGSIHLTFEKFMKEQTNLNHTPQTKTGLAGLIIHEASHKFANTKDHAYLHEQSKYAAMTSAQALENADSYAFAALSIYCDRLIDEQYAAGLVP